MATFRKRGNSYQIRVSCGYDTSGKQVIQTMSWKPTIGMKDKQIEKEIQKQAALFEEKCKSGQITSNIKFQSFAEQWFEEYAVCNLRSNTYACMKQLTIRVYPAIGHLRLDKITRRDIQQFINDLALNGKSLKDGKPLSRKTVVHHLSFISDVFSYAVKMEMLTDNPCKNIDIPKVAKKKKEKDIYTLEEIAQQQSAQYPHVRIVCGCSLEELDAALAEVEALEGLPVGTCGGHACDWETSVMMMLNEDYVRREKLQRGHVGALTEELLHRFFEDGVMSVSEIGVMGDPTGADAARGIRYFQYMQDMQEKAVRKHLMEWDKKKCNQHAE